MFNCHVDGGEDPTIRDFNPLEALLALCRVIGVDYDIREHNGKWACTLTSILDWPGDFYGGAGSQGGRSKWTTCNSASRLDALNDTIPMLFSSLHRSCTAWREIAKTHPEYQNWFKKDQEKIASDA